MALPPQFQKTSKGKGGKKPPGKGKAPPFGKGLNNAGAPPGAASGAKSAIDPATLSSMTSSLKNVGK